MRRSLVALAVAASLSVGVASSVSAATSTTPPTDTSTGAAPATETIAPQPLLPDESSAGAALVDFAEAAERRAERERRARERAARAAQRAAADLVGVQPSVYTGRHYDARSESVRLCIVERESMGYYDVVSSNGTWHGAYQFALGTSNVAAQRMGRPDLVGVPASRWDRAEQDEAFWTMWDHGRGAGHWAGGRWAC